MNLAEIRKKAEGDKKAVTVVETAPRQEVEINPDFPEQDLESYDEAAELFAAAAEAEAFSLLPELSFVEEESLLPDESQSAVETDMSPEIPVDLGMPQSERPPLVSEVETEPCDSAPAVTDISTCYNPLATILSGRAEAVVIEESSASRLLSLAAADVEEYLCFRVADEEYALNIMSIKEIIKPRDVTEVPRMPGFVSGVISLRGVIIPVLDMRIRLSLPIGKVTGRERIVVLRTEAGFCGVFVDIVVQVAKIRKSDIEEPPAVLEEIDRKFVRGLGHFDNRMLILLNLETIIDISIL